VRKCHCALSESCPTLTGRIRLAQSSMTQSLHMSRASVKGRTAPDQDPASVVVLGEAMPQCGRLSSSVSLVRLMTLAIWLVHTTWIDEAQCTTGSHRVERRGLFRVPQQFDFSNTTPSSHSAFSTTGYIHTSTGQGAWSMHHRAPCAYTAPAPAAM
jgi:hypothetical protein